MDIIVLVIKKNALKHQTNCDFFISQQNFHSIPLDREINVFQGITYRPTDKDIIFRVDTHWSERVFTETIKLLTAE